MDDMSTFGQIIRDVSLTNDGYLTIQVSVLLISYTTFHYRQNKHGLTTIIGILGTLNCVVKLIVSATLSQSVVCFAVQRDG